MTSATLPALAIGIAVLLILMSARPALAQWRLQQRARRLGTWQAPALPGAKRRSTAAPILRGGDGGWLTLLETALPGHVRLEAMILASGLTIRPAHALACGLALTAAAGVACIVVGMGGMLAAALGLAAGFGVPLTALRMLASRRRRAFELGFPDALGLIVRGLKAGLPIGDIVVEAGREISGPVGSAFRGVGDQLQLGQPLEVVLWGMARRLMLPAFDFFVITLSVQRETGGNLAETLGSLDSLLRAREAMQLKIRAMASEAVASAAIIAALPLVMGGLLYFASPGYLAPLLTTSAGHALLGIAALSMAVGGLVMRAMVRFEP